MKRTRLLILTVLLASGAAAQTTWTIDKSHSKIGFSVVHMVVAEVEGKFNEYEGKVVASNSDFNGADVEFTAKSGSVDTGNERRDNHLRADDFFNAEKYPEVKFKGKLVKEGDKYLLKGDFTMRDVTKPVTFDVTYGGTINTGRGEKAGFKITGKVNRIDYGLKWNRAIEAGGVTVGEIVDIICKIELDKQVNQ